MAEKEKTPEEIAQDKATKAFEAALPPAGPLLAARVTDNHLCPMIDGIKPHVGGPITVGCPTVKIGFLDAARVGDVVTCVGPPDAIAKGSATVKIGFMPAARFLDQTVHGGVIVMGCPTVIIGDVGMGGAGSPQGKAITAGQESGAAFCEECAKG